MKIISTKIGTLLLLTLLVILGCGEAHSQSRRSAKTYVKGGLIVRPDTTRLRPTLIDSLALDSLSFELMALDSLALDTLSLDSLALDSLMTRRAEIDSLITAKRAAIDSLATDSLSKGEVIIPLDATDSLFLAEAASTKADSLATPLAMRGAGATPLDHFATPEDEEIKKKRQPYISDSMSLSRMSLVSAVLPGFGQIYNKQYWKLPILYGTMATGIALYVNENKTYQPLKEEYDNLILSGLSRTDELDAVQTQMIKSNTRRQLYMGATVASYVYFLGDAAVNYSTNDVSDVKKATTLSMICPGAGQVYNQSYWRLPFVMGLFATTIYVYDWNNRGYQRFKQAYTLRLDYDNNPDNYPNGSVDEFGGAYSASLLQSYRDSYRRNRDYAVILTLGVYLLQVMDAHVDAHLKDFDISDDLTMRVQPTINYYSLSDSGASSPVCGLNFNFKF